jgi:putative transposase
MTRALGSPAAASTRGTFRRPCCRRLEGGQLGQRIFSIHEEIRCTYKVSRIHAELAADGTHVGRKRVARLMRQNGIRGVSRRKWTTTDVLDLAAVVAPHLAEGSAPRGQTSSG